MRILAITNLYPNLFHPQRATFNREQFRALARDHELTVISPIAWTEELSARRSGHPALPAGRRMEVDGIPVEYPRSLFIPRIFRGLYGRSFRWSIRGAFRRNVKTFQPHLVLATWAYPDGWAAIDLARRPRLPVVLKVHGSDILELHRHPGRRRGTIEALRRADRIIAVSRDLARRTVELGAHADRVHLIYNGVDDAVFCPGDRAVARSRLRLRSDRSMLLYVGNLLPVKGPDVLIDAAGLLAGRGVDFDLHVIGKGPLRASLERQAANLGLAHRVMFHGPVHHDQLPDWFRAADQLVLPSRSEGVPNVLLEAASCGTPYVASRVGGVPEIEHLGAGRLVPREDLVALADAMQETLLHPPPDVRPRRVRTHADAARELSDVFESLIRGDYGVSRNTLYQSATNK